MPARLASLAEDASRLAESQAESLRARAGQSLVRLTAAVAVALFAAVAGVGLLAAVAILLTPALGAGWAVGLAGLSLSLCAAWSLRRAAGRSAREAERGTEAARERLAEALRPGEGSESGRALPAWLRRSVDGIRANPEQAASAVFAASATLGVRRTVRAAGFGAAAWRLITLPDASARDGANHRNTRSAASDGTAPTNGTARSARR